jgi:L-histidine Nalpha-methyltransferase
MSGQTVPGQAASVLSQFREDVLRGLRKSAKELPCKYFYDDAGSRLFERICELPEYYLMRAELAIMNRHVGDIAELIGSRSLVIEYGSGSGVKTELLLDHLRDPAAYVPIDLAQTYLEHAAAGLLNRYPGLQVQPICGDFTQAFELPALRATPQKRVVYFPGSTIGNFTPQEATALLKKTAELCGPGGRLLLGADLKKDPAVLHLAYNDPQGVTAAFNLNLLHRINRELSANFQADLFWHHALYNPCPGRIEMYLVARTEQRVRVAGDEFHFREGECIRTEYSYKYSIQDVHELAKDAGFAVTDVWTDEARQFSVHYFVVKDNGASRL